MGSDFSAAAHEVQANRARMGSPQEELPTAVWQPVGAYSRLLGTNFGQMTLLE